MLTAKKKRLFLESLSHHGNISEACRTVKISPPAIYGHRDRDVVFRKAWDDAVESAAEKLEREAWRRAVEGWEEPVYGPVERGKWGEVGKIRRYSHTLLIFLLKGAKPAKYADRKLRVEGSIEMDLGKRLEEARKRLQIIEAEALAINQKQQLRQLPAKTD